MVCRTHQVVEDGFEFFAKRQLIAIISVPSIAACRGGGNSHASLLFGPLVGGGAGFCHDSVGSEALAAMPALAVHSAFGSPVVFMVVVVVRGLQSGEARPSACLPTPHAGSSVHTSLWSSLATVGRPIVVNLCRPASHLRGQVPHLGAWQLPNSWEFDRQNFSFHIIFLRRPVLTPHR